ISSAMCIAVRVCFFLSSLPLPPPPTSTLFPYTTLFRSLTAQVLAAWHDGEVRDVHQDMMRLTSRIASRTLLGIDVGAEVEEIEPALEVIIKEIAVRFRRPFPIPDSVPTPRNLRYRQAHLQPISDRSGDLLLDREHILGPAVEPLRPEIVAVRHVDELRGDPQLGPRLPDAALEHAGDGELVPDDAQILVLALE